MELCALASPTPKTDLPGGAIYPLTVGEGRRPGPVVLSVAGWAQEEGDYWADLGLPPAWLPLSFLPPGPSNSAPAAASSPLCFLSACLTLPSLQAQPHRPTAATDASSRAAVSPRPPLVLSAACAAELSVRSVGQKHRIRT